MTDLFLTATWWSAIIVLSATIGYAVGRDRERAAHETRIVPLPEGDALDRLLVDGGSLRAARHEQRQLRRIK